MASCRRLTSGPVKLLAALVGRFRGEEGFVSVHISDTGDDFLVAEHCLYGGFSFVKELAKKSRSGTRLKWLGA